MISFAASTQYQFKDSRVLTALRAMQGVVSVARRDHERKRECNKPYPSPIIERYCASLIRQAGGGWIQVGFKACTAERNRGNSFL